MKCPTWKAKSSTQRRTHRDHGHRSVDKNERAKPRWKNLPRVTMASLGQRWERFFQASVYLSAGLPQKLLFPEFPGFKREESKGKHGSA